MISNNVLDCGKEYFNRHQYIKNGKFELVGTAPWYVGIYQISKTATVPEYFCGGSIIASNVVISGKIIVQCI